jgi:hypothetical protein
MYELYLVRHKVREMLFWCGSWHKSKRQKQREIRCVIAASIKIFLPEATRGLSMLIFFFAKAAKRWVSRWRGDFVERYSPWLDTGHTVHRFVDMIGQTDHGPPMHHTATIRQSSLAVDRDTELDRLVKPSAAAGLLAIAVKSISTHSFCETAKQQFRRPNKWELHHFPTLAVLLSFRSQTL